MSADRRRALPSVDAVVRAAPASDIPRPRLLAAVREVLRQSREGEGPAPDSAALAKRAAALIAERDSPTLRRVINATGVILHTNLGRAPLSPAAIQAVGLVAGSASIEYDLALGRRGERHGHAASVLSEVTGAEDGVVTNNGAAALLLALAALGSRREVIVARGELVEIGGGFRIPDVLARSGAKLVEVGTTNRSYLRDYTAAITDRSAVILRVHASNFRIVGFTARAESAQLAALASERGLHFVHDLGSGTLLDTARYGLGKEETVQEAVSAGADVVTFSGDKLLGGPQAGIAVGRTAVVAKLRAHPLMRALRPDKLTIAALVATLAAYRDGTAQRDLPVWRMISASEASLAKRARALAKMLGAEVITTQSTVGGGALPEETQRSRAVALVGSPNRLALALRRAPTPVIGRVVEGRFALDLRSVLPEDDDALSSAVLAVSRSE